MENIENLKKFPEKLLKAKNVTSIVIDGIRLDKKIVIQKAKVEAEFLLRNSEFLSKDGFKKLLKITEL